MNWFRKYVALIALGFTAEADEIDCLISMFLIVVTLIVIRIVEVVL